MKLTKVQLIQNSKMFARLNVAIPKMGIEIRNVIVFRSDGKEWVSMPSYTFEDEDGKKKWAPYVYFMDKAHGGAWERAVKDLLNQWLVNQNAG